MSESEQRLAKNEVIFREINERTRSLHERFDVDDPTAYEEFLCECGDERCVERVMLTPREYESIRAEATQFVLKPGHSMPQIERVVSEQDRFSVVVKVGDAADVAAIHDPRA